MEVKRLLDVLDRHLADNRFIRAGRKKSASARPSSAGEWSTAPAGGLKNNCASGMTPAISRPKRRTRSTRAGNPTVIPHKSSRRCQPHFCCEADLTRQSRNSPTSSTLDTSHSRPIGEGKVPKERRPRGVPFELRPCPYPGRRSEVQPDRPMNVSAMTRLVSTFPEALGALVIFREEYCRR